VCRSSLRRLCLPPRLELSCSAVYTTARSLGAPSRQAAAATGSMADEDARDTEPYPLPRRGDRVVRLAFPQAKTRRSDNAAAEAFINNVLRGEGIGKYGVWIINAILGPILIVVACIPLFLINQRERSNTFIHSGEELCKERSTEDGFEGDPDFYGLGIRVGLYIQWFASIVANVFLPEERRFMAAAYSILYVCVYFWFCVFIFVF
jgi:hypothetical protein